MEVPSTDEGAEVRFRRGSCYQGTEVVSFQNMIPGWWFQTFFLFSIMTILPIDFYIFQDG